MDLRKFLLGRGEFKSPSEIIALIQGAREFDSRQEDIAHAEALLIFQTSSQQTWLVATSARLYCVLDDLNKSVTRVQWSIPADRLVTNGHVTGTIATRDKTERTGLIDVGGRGHWWLYSKKLFASEGIEARIKELIARRMSP